MFEIVHSDNNNTQAGYAAVDSIMFDYSPDKECEVLPPDAIVKPTAPPAASPQMQTSSRTGAGGPRTRGSTARRTLSGTGPLELSRMGSMGLNWIMTVQIQVRSI